MCLDCKHNWQPTGKTAIESDKQFNCASVVGVMLHLSSNTRPDISFAVSQVARFTHRESNVITGAGERLAWHHSRRGATAECHVVAAHAPEELFNSLNAKLLSFSEFCCCVMTFLETMLDLIKSLCVPNQLSSAVQDVSL